MSWLFDFSYKNDITKNVLLSELTIFRIKYPQKKYIQLVFVPTGPVKYLSQNVFPVLNIFIYLGYLLIKHFFSENCLLIKGTM